MSWIEPRIARSKSASGSVEILPWPGYNSFTFRNGVKLDFIRPGKPIENAYIESFNGRLRQECLNQSWFSSLEDAKIKIEAWRADNNDHRPHTSLGNQTPERFESEWQLSRTAKEGIF
jgi:putative transposase